MRAITLIQPMAAAIVHGTKRIENRPRPLPKSMQGVETIVAVHGGMGWNHEYELAVHDIDGVWEYRFLSNGFHQAHFKRAPYWEHAADRGLVGLMLLSGRTFTEDCLPCVSHPDGAPRVNSWWSGPYGYDIVSAIAFPSPVSCRGFQGWWPVPKDIESAISPFLIEELHDLAVRS